MADTTHLVLPLLAAAQAQKHVTHNGALQRLDAMVQLAVKDRDLTSPPGSPSDGDRYIPASGATGDWSGWDLNVAWYSDGVWAKLVPRAGWIAYVEDEDVVLIHDGSNWALLPAAMGTWRLLAASAAAASHTGDTDETVLATVPVPPGAMGPNGILRITPLWSFTGSSNLKTLRTRLNGIAGTVYGLAEITTALKSHRQQVQIANRGAEDSQVGFGVPGGSGLTSSGWSGTGATNVTSAIDTSSAVDLVLTGQLANASETVTLESLSVELFYQA